MTKFASTQSSTTETDRFVTTLPSPYKEAIQGYIDDSQRYQDSPAHARRMRTDSLDRAIEQCYRDHQVYLESFPLRKRTEELRKKLDSAMGRPNCRYDLIDVPCRKKLKQVVYRLAPEYSK